MASYQLKGKYAIVTGGGSGINLAITKSLLENGCSVIIADVHLRPEAEQVISAYPHSPSAHPATGEKPSAIFQPTDVADWTQLSSLWESALKTFGAVHIVVNGAGWYDPSSNFWHPPGISPLAKDAADQTNGTYKTFSVNTLGPIRLAQIAIDYWFSNRDIEGNLLWIASAASYGHLLLNPFYCASKAASASIVKSLGPLKQIAGIRISALCPGTVRTPFVAKPHLKWALDDDDPALSPEQVADVALQVLTEPQYGNGNIIETQMGDRVGEDGKTRTELCTREVPLELLYPPLNTKQSVEKTIAETIRVAEVLGKKGMRSDDVTI